MMPTLHRADRYLYCGPPYTDVTPHPTSERGGLADAESTDGSGNRGRAGNRRRGSVRQVVDRAGGEDGLASLPALFGVPVVLAESCPICGVVPDSIHVHDLSIPEVLPARWPA